MPLNLQNGQKCILQNSSTLMSFAVVRKWSILYEVNFLTLFQFLKFPVSITVVNFGFRVLFHSIFWFWLALLSRFDLAPLLGQVSLHFYF